MPTFAEGLSQGKRDKADQDRKKELRDLQVKALKSQLELKDKQQEAQARFATMFEPSSAPLPGQEGPPTRQEAMTAPSNKPKSFIEAISDPEGQISGLLSGNITPKDIGLAQQRQQTQQILKQFLQGGQGAAGGVDPVSALIAGITGDITKLTPEAIVTKTVETPEGPRIKSFTQRGGKEIADIGAAKAEKVTPEQAGRLTAATSAEQNASDVRAAIEATSGLDRRALLSTMATAMPFTKGRELRFKMADAADAVVRLRTGATANETELKQILEQFMPSPLDSEEGVQDKLDRFDRFIGGAIDAVTLPPSLKKKIEAQRPKKKPSLNMNKVKAGDISKMSDEELEALASGQR